MIAKKPLRAVLYARYSTDRQRKESAEDQFRMCRRVAEREGAKVVATYSDPGISGGTAQRPEYQAMRASARAREFDIVIAEDLKRLWREQAEQWACIKEWLDLGIHVVTVSGTDSRQKGFALIASVQGAAAELERKEAGYRTRRGMEGNALADRKTGGKAYGYDTGDKGRTINRAEAKIVLRIFKMRRDGASPKTIARTLNEEGILSPGASWRRRDTGKHRKPTDKGWRSNAITGDPTRGTGILNNCLYNGHVIWGRTQWTRSEVDSKVRKVTYLPQDQWVRHFNKDLRIVPDELWHAVQEIQTRRDPSRDAVRMGARRAAKGGRGRGPGYWLSSIIVCKECGANYIGYGPKDYICATRVNGGKCGNGLHFSREETHANMFALLEEHALRPEIIVRERKRLLTMVDEQDEANRAAAARGIDTRAVDAQIAALKPLRGTLGPAAYGAALATLERERAALVAVGDGKAAAEAARLRKLVRALPDLAEELRTAILDAIKSGAPAVVERTREATRNLIRGGQILLRPTARRDAVSGPVELLGLGAHLLRVPAADYRPRGGDGFNKDGSGGRI